MFIKEAYAKRVKKQQDEDNESKLLVKKAIASKIGSIQNGKVNYDREEQFFSKDDVPWKVRTIKQQVKQFIDPDFLGLRKKEWNTSVSVPKNFQEQESHQRKLTKIRYGLFDHPIPNSSEPKIYDGAETRDDYSGWQVSTQVTKKQLKNNQQRIYDNAKKHSKSIQKRLLPGTYQTPIQKSTNLIETHKQKKTTQSVLRSTLKQQYKYLNPDASEEKTNATVFRLAYQTGLAVLKQDVMKNQGTIVQTKPFKANMTQTLMGKVTSKQFHNGIWQLFRINTKQGVEQYYAWSCCMNESHQNSGCITKKIDGNKWNLTSFNA